MKNDDANEKLGFQTLDVYVAARELVAVVGRRKSMTGNCEIKPLGLQNQSF
jgi:hypothetical protein